MEAEEAEAAAEADKELAAFEAEKLRIKELAALEAEKLRVETEAAAVEEAERVKAQEEMKALEDKLAKEKVETEAAEA